MTRSPCVEMRISCAPAHRSARTIGGSPIWAEGFVVSEYFDWRFMVAVVEIAVFLLFHNDLFGVSPFPNAWQSF